MYVMVAEVIYITVVDTGRRSLYWSLLSQGVSLKNVLDRRQMGLRASQDVDPYRKLSVSAGH
jgi:hypothetical protein